MAPLRISDASTEYVLVPVYAITDGSVTAQFGWGASAAIEPVGWSAATWLTPSGRYFVKFLVVAGSLAVGTHYLWVRMTTGPETVVKFSGTVEVY
jgi:hypothetical protein